MPRISEFYGIFIYMYFSDHAPPHFHAIYAQHEAEIAIATGETLKGYLPKRALRLVQEWAEHYRAELMVNWKRARAHKDLTWIPALD